MLRRRRSVLLRVALLVLIPLVLLVGLSAYQFASSVRVALTLLHSKVMMDDLGAPVARLQSALTAERAQTVVYSARPTAAALAQLRRAQAGTDRAVAAVLAVTASPAVRQSASPDGAKAIAGLRMGLAGLRPLRAKVLARTISGLQAFTAYNNMVAASYQVVEQAIIQEGNASQVLPGVAVIELAISDEYLQQESALLDGDFAVGAFPASAHQAFVRLVGAHRLLYAQSYSYLTRSDRASLNRDVGPRLPRIMAMLEDRVVASAAPRRPPPVSAATWNQTVAQLSSGTERAVSQAEARLEATARSKANTRLREIYLTGGLGLAAVIISILLSLWISVNLTRQLRRLRDTALDMATVRLPDVMRRLRAGEEVDVTAEMPGLDVSSDEIGQVKAAFNTAQRAAVEAAVDQARMRRGVNDVFRNLARRSQSLLERQMALLDVLERRTTEPDDLEGLFRIDHLTTRMRRHAESLIVLAGDSPKRAFRDPVPLVDVLRAAAAEVEDYKRIRVMCRSKAALAGPAVADAIHLLAEFIENAAAFSPANTEVRVAGDLVANGFAVDIEDRGLGMSDEEISDVNASLARPPLFDLSGSDQLGLFVAAQLARRHGIQVTLRHSAYGGVTAIILVPLDLVIDAGDDYLAANGAGPARVAGRRAAPAARRGVTAPADTLPPADVLPPADALPAAGTAAPADGLTSAGTAAPAGALRPAGALPHSDAVLRADALPHSDAVLPADALPPATTVPRSDAGAFFAGLPTSDGLLASADPRAGHTENGLPLRVRQASLAPQLHPASTATAPLPSPVMRSPEAARDVMSAFQRGWRRGLSEAQTDQGPAC